VKLKVIAIIIGIAVIAGTGIYFWDRGESDEMTANSESNEPFAIKSQCF
jgi:hypothetical protein